MRNILVPPKLQMMLKSHTAWKAYSGEKDKSEVSKCLLGDLNLYFLDL